MIAMRLPIDDIIADLKDKHKSTKSLKARILLHDAIESLQQYKTATEKKIV